MALQVTGCGENARLLVRPSDLREVCEAFSKGSFKGLLLSEYAGYHLSREILHFEQHVGGCWRGCRLEGYLQSSGDVAWLCTVTVPSMPEANALILQPFWRARMQIEHQAGYESPETELAAIQRTDTTSTSAARILIGNGGGVPWHPMEPLGQLGRVRVPEWSFQRSHANSSADGS